MKHLIIGYGNMGRRHAEILRGFGDQVDSVDLEWRPEAWDYNQYNSVILATPPKTHKDAIIAILCESKYYTPIFIEKPLISEIWTDYNRVWRHRVMPITGVACNWRYCQCADMSSGFIEMGYPADSETAYLDMIHFLDLFWLNYGEPEFGGISRMPKDRIEMTVSGAGKMLNVLFDPTSEKPYTRKEGKLIHRRGVCDMFVRQMRDWRECLTLQKQHLNSLSVALDRTTWLIERYAKSVLA